jgi:hypothetical protein
MLTEQERDHMADRPDQLVPEIGFAATVYFNNNN